ncbi:TIGR03663 family protein [soil metagenome]
MPWIILAVCAVLRVLLLAIKPPHFDEGINGWFVDQMTKNGFYRYDPTNYHGPLHFYVLFLSQTLFGRNLWALRMPVVLASIACVWLTLRYEVIVGRTISRWAALAMAVSPAFVFYGRYSIHEVWLLLFQMVFVLGGLGLWRFGTSRYLWCTGMGLAGMILTKETYIIHLGSALLALLVAWLTHKLFRAENTKLAPQTWSSLDLTMVVFVGVAAVIFFYYGTFYNWAGVKGLYSTFAAWFKTGQAGKSGHEKDWWYWLMLIGRYEVVVAAALLASAACLAFKDIALRYLAIYGVGLLAAYSIVKYKTPWCMINIVWPLLFIFGAALLLIPQRYRRVGHIVAGLLLAVSLVQSIRLNFFRCTTDTEPYVYVQTYNDVFKLTDPLLKLAHENPANYHLVGHVIRTSAYPLPWMLGDFNRVGYYENENLPAELDADFLVVQEDKIQTVEPQLHGTYYTVPFTIRPYQDTSKLYLNAKVFQQFFPGKVPDFAGR